MAYKSSPQIRFLIIVFLAGSLFASLFTPSQIMSGLASIQADNPWPMAGANPQRTSWTPENLPGSLAAEWVKPIVPHIQQKTQVIAAENKLFISTARGLYAFQAATGADAWVFPTELPLGNSPSYWNGVLYVGGFDRKLYAVNAVNGQKIWSLSARAGFSTNPLVVNQKVYLGDRDGNFYAVNASDGSLAWEYAAGGQIFQSAAYLPEDDGLSSTGHGTVIFPANDAHVYALDADMGNLVWKSPKLPGGGWYTWWPVIYRDYVVLVTTRIGRTDDSDLLLGGASQDSVPGILGNTPGDWATGETTLDLRTNPYGTSYPDLLEQYPSSKRMIFLDKRTGLEAAFDLDSDGQPDGAPVAWTGDAGSIGYPVVSAYDDVIYFRSVTHAEGEDGGGIDGGGIFGWKVSTPLVSLPYSKMGGQSSFFPSDEPLGLSAAGNKIYWNLTDDRFVGAIDISVPNSTWPIFKKSRQWRYVEQGSEDYCLQQSPSLPLCYETEAKKFWWHPPTPAVFWAENDKVGPVAYQGRLYNLMGNALVAFSPSGLGKNAPVYASAPIVPASGDSLPVETILKGRLEQEVMQIIQSGHLKPAWVDVGLLNSELRTNFDDLTLQYWHNPADIQNVLLDTLPFLNPTLQQQVRAYLQSEFALFPPYQFSHVGWTSGTPRDPYIYPPSDPRWFDTDYGPLPGSGFGAWCLPPHNIYAVWKYAAAGLGDPLSLYDSSQAKLSVPISANNSLLTDDYLAQFPHVHNAYIAGYWGYVELAKLANRPQAEFQAYQNELNRLLNLRLQNFTVFPYHYSTKPELDHYYSMITVWNFLYLTPELADFLMENIPALVQEAIGTYESIAPHWMLAHNGETQGENAIMPYQQTHSLFQAKALILNQSQEQLYKFLDAPVVPVGDLYYLDNLVAILEAPGSGPSPTQTGTPSASPTGAPSSTATHTQAPTATPTPAVTRTATSSATVPPTPHATFTPTYTASPIPTSTGSPSPTPTNSPTPTGTPISTTPPGLIFADSFEAGDFSRWTASSTDGGDLSVSSTAGLAGQFGMQAFIDDTREIYVTDHTPNSETRYRMRFYFHPHAIQMSKGNAHYILYGVTGSNTPVLRLELNFSNGQYRLRAGTRNNANTWTDSSYFTITNAAHLLEIEWKAATSAKSSNGSLSFWIDGALKAALTGINNNTRRVDSLLLGAVAGIDYGTLGISYFDAFESFR